MRAEDRQPVLDLLETAFGMRGLFARYMDFDPDFRYSDYLLHVEDGRPLSCVQLFEKRIRLRGEVLPLGGIGSVATAPDARKRGLASELLRRQAEHMRERGMPLGLLFTGRFEFYARLGWRARPLRQLALQRTEATRGEPGRAFVPDDLPQVMALYESCSAGLDGSVVRDEAYWRANLRYAGDRDFRVSGSGGRIDAYVRTVPLATLCLMEFAARPGFEAELAALVAGQVPSDAPLTVRLPARLGLEPALEAAGLELTEIPDRSPMWLVLDREKLAALAGLDGDPDDAAVLDAIDPHYWLADRF